VALAEAGHEVERRHIDLTTAIKSLGIYEATIHLHPEVALKVKIQVARSAESLLAQELEAKPQDEAPEAEAVEEEHIEEEAGDDVA
jgi:large subunit ribosomal protein L9